MNAALIDNVTSFFNFGAIFIAWLNVKVLLRDKELKGYSIYAAVFFLAWAGWGIPMYHWYGLKWSMIASTLLCIAYLYWVGLILWYKQSKGLH